MTETKILRGFPIVTTRLCPDDPVFSVELWNVLLDSNELHIKNEMALFLMVTLLPEELFLQFLPKLRYSEMSLVDLQRVSMIVQDLDIPIVKAKILAAFTNITPSCLIQVKSSLSRKYFQIFRHVWQVPVNRGSCSSLPEHVPRPTSMQGISVCIKQTGMQSCTASFLLTLYSF
jgi:hypothetical protein